MWKSTIFATMLTVLSTGAVSAATFDFTSLTDGTEVTNQFTGFTASLEGTTINPTIVTVGVPGGTQTGLINASSPAGPAFNLAFDFDEAVTNLQVDYVGENIPFDITLTFADSSTSTTTIPFDGDLFDIDTFVAGVSNITRLEFSDLAGSELLLVTELRFDNVSAVPVPAALPLLLTGLFGFAVAGWRRRKSA